MALDFHYLCPPMARRKKLKRMAFIFLGIIAAAAIGIVLFMHSPRFGQLPKGERLARIEKSPYYKNGQFQNLHPVPASPDSLKGNFLGNLWKFVFAKTPGIKPPMPIKAVKTDLHRLAPDLNCLVWFGHSSYLIQNEGKRFLIDPVFCQASPVRFANKAFPGSEIYKPEDMPGIDYLVISHDHWDHLDYHTVKALKDRIGKVICPLGVGQHFERWGFAPEQLIELEWYEEAVLDSGWRVHCRPTRHFSGRSLRRNPTHWASFLLECPSRKIYIAGDGGYDTHFAEIGKEFAPIDWAIMENGQYNKAWKYIHLMPEFMSRAAKETDASHILTVHHSKYALARHPWDEPLSNARKMKERDSLPVVIPQIGEVVLLEDGSILAPDK